MEDRKTGLDAKKDAFFKIFLRVYDAMPQSA